MAATAHVAHPLVSVPVTAEYPKDSTAPARPSQRVRVARVAAVVVAEVVETAAAATGVAVAAAALVVAVVAVVAVLLAIEAQQPSTQRAPWEPFFYLTPAKTKWSADARPPGGSNGRGSRGQTQRPRAKGRR